MKKNYNRRLDQLERQLHTFVGQDQDTFSINSMLNFLQEHLTSHPEDSQLQELLDTFEQACAKADEIYKKADPEQKEKWKEYPWQVVFESSGGSEVMQQSGKAFQYLFHRAQELGYNLN